MIVSNLVRNKKRKWRHLGPEGLTSIVQVGYKRKSGFLIHIQIQFFMLIPNPSSKTAPHFSEIFLNLVLDSSSVKTAPLSVV